MARVVHIVEYVKIPEGIKIEIKNKTIAVQGPKGEMIKSFDYAKDIDIRIEGDKIVLETFFANSRKRALLYTISSHINNMIIGVTKGWRYKLKVISSHFPVTVKVIGNNVVIENFLGEKSPRKARILEGVNVRIEGKDIIVEGVDIEKVAQTAANIEMATKVRDKDRRIFVDGIYIYERGVAE
ncbi:MAG: 50S ribosomal protein L6 [Ignisphaera sp.]|jgi:large subunit ribosomal protein L6|nr:50S ribosomal protein L6 [Ignisphaera sp.]MCC6055788.1 50S ribosomal protein L6 [Desulfurococcaceae archaeon]